MNNIYKVAQDSDIDSLISQLIGTSPQSATKEETLPKAVSPTPSSNEVYSLPIRVGRDNKPITKNNKPWIVGTFIPNQYVNPTHITGHNGVDLKAPKGTPIYPIASGIVSEVKQYPKGGNTCKVSSENGNVISYYAHMDTVNAIVGAKVTQNSILGTVGDSGNAVGRGAHLHIEVAVDGKKIDPFSVIGKKVDTLSHKEKVAAIFLTLNKYAKPKLSDSQNIEAKIIDQFLIGAGSPVCGQDILEIIGNNSGAELGIIVKTLKNKISEQPEITKKAALQFITNYKQASDFQVPPELLSAVESWAVDVWIKQVWLVNLYEEYSMETKEIIDKCSQYTSRPAENILMSETKRFPLNLMGNWKYLNNKEKKYFNETLKKTSWPDSIPITLFLGQENWPQNLKDGGGIYFPDEDKSRIKIILSIHTDARDIYEFIDELDELKNMCRHELQHLGQDILSSVKNIHDDTSPGIPPNKIRDKYVFDPYGRAFYDLPKNEQEYDLIDVEFYPLLKDSIERFRRALPYEINPQQFFKFWIDSAEPNYQPQNKNIIGPDEFFENLKKGSMPKWQKAVSELWKSFN